MSWKSAGIALGWKQWVGSFEMMRFLPSRELFRRVFGTVWVLICIWLLVWTLLQKGASVKALGEVEEAEALGMLGLSAPLSFLIVLFLRWISLAWWIYPWNDVRTIVAIWLFIFFIGCVQWFVFFPWVVDRGYELYDFMVPKIRRRFGRQQAVGSDYIPKV